MVSSSSRWLETMTRWCPRWASCRQYSSPMPEVAPVMSASIFLKYELRWVLLIQKLEVKVGVKMEVKMDNTVDDQAFVLFDVSPLDFLNLFNFLFNSILFNL